jgi:hypothetical protein
VMAREGRIGCLAARRPPPPRCVWLSQAFCWVARAIWEVCRIGRGGWIGCSVSPSPPPLRYVFEFLWGSSAVCQNITWHFPLSFKAFKDVVCCNVSNIGKYMGFSVGRLPFFKVITKAVFLFYFAFKTSAWCQCELLTHCLYLLTRWIHRSRLWDQFCIG